MKTLGTRPVKVIAVVFAFSCAMAGGTAVALPLLGGAHSAEPSKPAQHADSFKVNESGLTYGSDFDTEETPDLVLAIGDKGETGYVKATELYGEPPKNDEEAAQMNANAGKARVLTLYAEDGKTIIGTFTTSPTGVSEGPPK